MRLDLISVGERQPAWVDTGFDEYARRLAGGWRLKLIPIAAAKRNKGRTEAQLRAEEGKRLLAAVPRDARVIALDASGRKFSNEQLADKFRHWMVDSRPVALFIGGADGLAPECIERADFLWSLSPLIFPHGLVRVMVAEQIYRSWSIINGRPYHRA